MQDKRDLVNSIVARAHLHEEQASFSDALNDWEILRTIYSQYPGLKFEVERLQKRRDQQSRIESRTHLIEQIDSCLHSSDYTRAFELAAAGSRRISQRRRIEGTGKACAARSRAQDRSATLMAEGQDLCAQQKPAEGIRLLRQAYELDENNPLARAVLANTLVEQAQALVETDWHEAEKLAKEAFESESRSSHGQDVAHPDSRSEARDLRRANRFRRPASCKPQEIWRRPCLGSRKRFRPIRARCG